MMQGDLRYGYITDQHLKNYNVEGEFYKRKNIAETTCNLEYVVDAYNMLRIESFKNNEENTQLAVDCLKLIRLAFTEDWELISIDDGIHAEEQ